MDSRTALAIPSSTKIRFKRYDNDYIGEGEYLGMVTLSLAQSELENLKELLAHAELTDEQYKKVLKGIELAHTSNGVAKILADDGTRLYGFICEWYPIDDPPNPLPF